MTLPSLGEPRPGVEDTRRPAMVSTFGKNQPISPEIQKKFPEGSTEAPKGVTFEM